jgi:iron complex outermembrane receptor protein
MVLRAERRNIYSVFRINHTGKRFTDADNSRYLPPFTVADLDIGIKMATRKTLTDIRLGVDNIFNIDYQNIAYYPMPQRNFILSVIFQIKK